MPDSFFRFNRVKTVLLGPSLHLRSCIAPRGEKLLRLKLSVSKQLILNSDAVETYCVVEVAALVVASVGGEVGGVEFAA